MIDRSHLLSRSRWLAAAALAVLAACASPAPPVQRQPAPRPVMEVQAPGPTVDLLCAGAADTVSFESMGISPYTQILDIALTPDRVWLLVDPTHLVELWRDPEERKFRAITGKEDAAWGALDVDPLDGSLWIVSSQRLELIHLIPDGQSRILKIPRLEGQGGFRDVLVEESGIYVVPTCAEHALWKVDRTGKLLTQEFHREGQEPLTLRESFTPEEGQGSITGCIPVSLARDADGRIAVFDGVLRSFYRRENDAWKPFLELPEPVRKELPSGGVRVDFPGTEQETWRPVSTYSGDAPTFFFAGETPVFLPSVIFLGDRWVPFLRYERPEPGGLSTAFERCQGIPRVSGGAVTVASDRFGYAAAFGNALVLGTFPEPQP